MKSTIFARFKHVEKYLNSRYCCLWSSWKFHVVLKKNWINLKKISKRFCPKTFNNCKLRTDKYEPVNNYTIFKVDFIGFISNWRRILFARCSLHCTMWLVKCNFSWNLLLTYNNIINILSKSCYFNFIFITNSDQSLKFILVYI